MSDFETVGKVDDFEEGVGRAFAVNGRMVAVYRRGQTFFAIDDFCPHMGASLAEGHVDGETVACPWHGWRFCIRDGTWEDNPRIKIDSFSVRVQGDEVQVLVEDRNPGAGTSTKT
jgi:nitrite reductase (NADH) small subunit